MKTVMLIERNEQGNKEMVRMLSPPQKKKKKKASLLQFLLRAISYEDFIALNNFI